MIANFSSWFVFKGGGSEISVKISRSSLWVSLSVIKSKSFVNLFSEHSSLLLSLLMLRHFRVLFIKTAWHNFFSVSWIDRSLFIRQILNVFFLMLPWSCLRLLFKKSGCLADGSFLNFPILRSGVRTVWTERRADCGPRLTGAAAEQQLLQIWWPSWSSTSGQLGLSSDQLISPLSLSWAPSDSQQLRDNNSIIANIL